MSELNDDSGLPPAPGGRFDPADLDLEGVSPADARDYLVRRVAYQKRLERDLAEAAGQVQHWRGRVELARSRGAGDLAVQAELRLKEVEARAARLSSEVDAERLTNERLQELVRQRLAFTPAVDAGQLAAELDALVGGESARAEREIAEKLADHAVEEELEALKRSLRERQGGAPGPSGGQGKPEEGEPK